MKRIIIILVVIGLAYYFYSSHYFEYKDAAIEKIDARIMMYKEEMDETAKKYGFNLLEDNTRSGMDGKTDIPYYYYYYIIKIDDSTKIEICISTSGAIARFNITYYSEFKELEEARRNINVPMIAQIINCMTYYETTEDYISEFFNAPEEKYHGRKETIGSTQQLIRKTTPYTYRYKFHMDYYLTDRRTNYSDKFTISGIVDGNLAYIHDDISTSGNKLPTGIKHIYN